MKMIYKFILDTSMLSLERVLFKIVIVIVMVALAVSTAMAEISKEFETVQLIGYAPAYGNETTDQRLRRLLSTSIEDSGGMKTAIADKQVRCLAENIYFESRGESLLGQVAVAKVTVNRLDEGYASTICGVVKAKGQFSWVGTNISKPFGDMWEQAVGIALLILNGDHYIKDPTNGATYFHATYIVFQPGWRRVKSSVLKIGNHVFYRVRPKEAK